MPDPAIEEFFQKRKEDWLKKETKASMSETEKQALIYQCEEIFSVDHWIPIRAKKAGSRAITTHPSKFSHPSTGIGKNNRKSDTYVTPVIFHGVRKPDGYLRTGNSFAEKDSVGDAAALDIDLFLNLKMKDGKTLIDHISNDSALARELLNFETPKYDEIRSELLELIRESAEKHTSSKIKQVYFPVEFGYHLLSILSNSGLIFELRQRIDKIRFSENKDTLRELQKNGLPSQEGFSDIYETTTIGYGGSNPQNISVLNTKTKGKFHLLMSAPPTLSKRAVQFPKHDFFASCIRYQDISEPVNKLHKIFITSLDGTIPLSNLRSGRDYRLQDIIDQVIIKMIAVRAVSQDQYLEEINNLPHFQQVWLCHQHIDERLQTDTWLGELCNAISRWILAAYKQLIKKPLLLGPAEIAYIQQAIEDNREVFR